MGSELHLAQDVLDAQRWFCYAYVEKGFGWFKDAQAAEDFFESISFSFTSAAVRQWAKQMRQADGHET